MDRPATARDAFLERVRQAVRAGNRPGSATAPPPRDGVGYQGAGPDAVARFCQELTAAGGSAHVVVDGEAAAGKVLELVQSKLPSRVLIGHGALLDTLNLPARLARLGIEPVPIASLAPELCRAEFFRADLGISGVDFLVAETGTVVICSRPEEPRSLSLLPPVHIAVAERAQLVPDLFDLFERLGAATSGESPVPSSCVTLITGPSKTGDIELRLVTGVHGPGEIHVVLNTA